MAEDDPWVIEDPEEAARAEADAAESAAAEAAAEAEGALAEGEGAEGAAPAEPEPELPPPRPPVEKDPNAPILCKHWVRPKFLNYGYIYDYRHKYYDDVIDYLNKRQKGLIAEIPRAQEWAERTARLYTGRGRLDSNFRFSRDSALLSEINASAKFYRYHSNAYVHRTYAKYLYQ